VRVRFVPHPSVGLLYAHHPVDAIWRGVLNGDDAALAGVDLDAGPVRLLVERSAAGVEVSRLDEPAWSFAAELCGGRVVEAAFAGAAITSADALLVEHLARGRFIDFCLAPPDLHRRELSPALRKTYTARLKALHEQEHPKSKGGRPSKTVPKAGKVSKPERFTKAHAKRTGRRNKLKSAQKTPGSSRKSTTLSRLASRLAIPRKRHDAKRREAGDRAVVDQRVIRAPSNRGGGPIQV
jgi:hypothetical protein